MEIRSFSWTLDKAHGHHGDSYYYEKRPRGVQDIVSGKWNYVEINIVQ